MSTSTLIFTFLFGLFALALLVVTATVTGSTVLKMYRAKKGPVNALPAKVLRRYERDGSMGVLGVESYHVEFEVEEERIIDFDLLPAQYAALVEGDTGLLLMRDATFAGFQSDTELGQRLRGPGINVPNRTIPGERWDRQ